MTELRLGLLGSGYMGRTYAECIAKYNNRGKLVAVAGGTRASGLAADYSVAHEPTYEALLGRSDVDAIVISTPHGAHRDQVVKAAQHGKHVLVEKPMATSVADCDSMITACRKAGVILEVVKTIRFRGVIVRAKRLIDEGKLGQIRMIRGQSLATGYFTTEKPWATEEGQGGPSLDMGTHNFDLMRFFTGSEAKLVFGQVVSYSPLKTLGLSAMTQITFKNGVMAQQWTCFEMPPPNIPDSYHRYTVVGEKGILEIDGYGALRLGTGDSWETVWEQPPMDFFNRPLDWVRLEAFATQTQHFIDDILDGRPPMTTGEDGRAAVEIVEASWLSTQKGIAVKLPLNAER